MIRKEIKQLIERASSNYWELKTVEDINFILPLHAEFPAIALNFVAVETNQAIVLNLEERPLVAALFKRHENGEYEELTALAKLNSYLNPPCNLNDR